MHGMSNLSIDVWFKPNGEDVYFSITATFCGFGCCCCNKVVFQTFDTPSLPCTFYTSIQGNTRDPTQEHHASSPGI
jgi:hypothetical protein